ncbi:phage regulatory CII family protein [Amorphus orientalis]|uniref:Uncharacterized protein n=1 Tax=Amorphus orientalis TaxID=649198 RepID=A0AAE3VML6_9HYPH|nr:phage regulatory CII family protein [Amorphus orientalis]MDQ0314821.1 hypothetical protein [Amorphus orientalis]
MADHARPHRSSDYLRLKAMTRRLVHAAGGIEAASLATRVGPQRISTYQRPHEPDFIPIDVVADLQADTDDLSVLRELARLAGAVVVPLPETPDEAGGPWHRHLADVASETSDVIKRLSESLADDGVVTAVESRNMHLTDEVDEAINALMRLRHRLEVVEGVSRGVERSDREVGGGVERSDREVSRGDREGGS